MDDIQDLIDGPKTFSVNVGVATGTNNIQRNVANMLRTYSVGGCDFKTTTIEPGASVSVGPAKLCIISTNEQLEVLTENGSFLVNKMCMLDNLNSEVIITNNSAFAANVQVSVTS